MSCVTGHVSHVMCHMSCATCYVSHVMCHMSYVLCHVSTPHNVSRYVSDIVFDQNFPVHREAGFPLLNTSQLTNIETEILNWPRRLMQ